MLDLILISLCGRSPSHFGDMIKKRQAEILAAERAVGEI